MVRLKQSAAPLWAALLELWECAGADEPVFRSQKGGHLDPSQVMRIVQASAEKLGLPMDKVVLNIGKYGNTTAGTIPLAARDAIADGRLKKGDLVLFAAVGAGFTVGASLWRWAF